MEIIQEEEQVYILNDKQEKIAYVLFPKLDEKTVVIRTTYVSEELRGLRIASKLLESTCEVLRKYKRKAILECSYAKRWFQEHKEYEDILK
ncbi:MAG: N-acetyltransferase [Anaeroplasmataceae bacterium]|nr:N-acetyltransferase [Anaeroplasmataceae bacterium]